MLSCVCCLSEWMWCVNVSEANSYNVLGLSYVLFSNTDIQTLLTVSKMNNGKVTEVLCSVGAGSHILGVTVLELRKCSTWPLGYAHMHAYDMIHSQRKLKQISCRYRFVLIVLQMIIL
jgi:hypothetical protein